MVRARARAVPRECALPYVPHPPPIPTTYKYLVMCYTAYCYSIEVCYKYLKWCIQGRFRCCVVAAPRSAKRCSAAQPTVLSC